MIFYKAHCHPLPYFLIFFKNPRKFSIVIPDLVQTKTNCIFLFIALTTCNVALGIRLFPYGNQYPWKYKIFPNISLKSNSKNIFYYCTSDDKLDHLLSHFTRAIDRLKFLSEKLLYSSIFLFFDVQQLSSYC